MIVVRSFPEAIPAGRNYVVDDAVKIYNAYWDYRKLYDFHDDIIHMDWDTAVSREDLIKFADAARQEPKRVLVAPQPLYESDPFGNETGWHWNCAVRDPTGLRRVTEGEQDCDEFGFGMVYLPGFMIEQYLQAHPLDEFRDTQFALWHGEKYGRARILWSVRTVHLHYRISEVIK